MIQIGQEAKLERAQEASSSRLEIIQFVGNPLSIDPFACPQLRLKLFSYLKQLKRENGSYESFNQ